MCAQQYARQDRHGRPARRQERFVRKARGALIDWGVHYLDIVMYCCGDPEALTVTGEAFSRLGCDLRGYAYKDMWAGPPDYEGTYDWRIPSPA